MHSGCIHLCLVACLDISINVTDFISHSSKLDSLVDPQQEERSLLSCHSLVTGIGRQQAHGGFSLGGLGNSAPQPSSFVTGR